MFWIDNGFYGINPPIPTVKCSNCKNIFNENVLKLDKCPNCFEQVAYKVKTNKITHQD